MASWIELAYNERYYANLWANMHAATRKNKMYKKNQKIWLIIYCTMVNVVFMWIAQRVVNFFDA